MHQKPVPRTKKTRNLAKAVKQLLQFYERGQEDFVI
jgi:hypothetical protein